MARSKKLTPALRGRICELHDIGWGYRRIHRRCPWISLSTIAYTIKKEPERKLGISKPRSGRRKKLTEDDKARILYVIAEQPRVTHQDLLSEVSYKVKKGFNSRTIEC
jgi:transposase